MKFLQFLSSKNLFDVFKLKIRIVKILRRDMSISFLWNLCHLEYTFTKTTLSNQEVLHCSVISFVLDILKIWIYGKSLNTLLHVGRLVCNPLINNYINIWLHLCFWALIINFGLKKIFKWHNSKLKKGSSEPGETSTQGKGDFSY
jgi:hypothetical protein